MIVKYQGHEISINEKLLDENNAWGNLKEILNLRIKIQGLLLEEEYDTSNKFLSKERAKYILDTLTYLEYQLQDAWGFEKDSNYHTYWLKLKGCSCPKLDNEERIGTGLYVRTGNCIYHGVA